MQVTTPEDLIMAESFLSDRAGATAPKQVLQASA